MNIYKTSFILIILIISSIFKFHYMISLFRTQTVSSVGDMVFNKSFLIFYFWAFFIAEIPRHPSSSVFIGSGIASQQRVDYWKDFWCWGAGGRRKGDNRRWWLDGLPWLTDMTLSESESWWTGRFGASVIHMGSQRAWHTEIESNRIALQSEVNSTFYKT